MRLTANKGALLLASGAVSLAVLLHAPADAVTKERSSSKNTAPIDQKVGVKMNKAIELLNAEKYDAAREILEKIDRRRLSPYEIARIESLLAAIAQGQEKVPLAREHLKKALESGGLNDQENLSTTYQIAQLWFADEHWKEGAEAIKSWMALPGAKPTAQSYYLLGIAYYQLKAFDAALEPAQKAVDMSDKPQEGWLQLLLALYLEREQYAPAIPVLRRLLQAAPKKKSYWMQLSSVYSTQEKYDLALATMEVAYYGGLLTEASEYRRLADLAINQNLPYRAAQILSRAIADKKLESDAKDMEKLGNCWAASRHLDKAIPPLNQAASLSESGDLYLRVAEIHEEREEWQKAVDAVSHAVEKGKLKNAAEAEILMGVAFINQKKLKEARTRFQKAAQDERKRNEAQGWLRYIENVTHAQ
jgi:tetratricopeptide (TPR) repeat protein